MKEKYSKWIIFLQIPFTIKTINSELLFRTKMKICPVIVSVLQRGRAVRYTTLSLCEPSVSNCIWCKLLPTENLEFWIIRVTRIVFQWYHSYIWIWFGDFNWLVEMIPSARDELWCNSIISEFACTSVRFRWSRIIWKRRTLVKFGWVWMHAYSLRIFCLSLWRTRILMW